jgi:hypothetical protein
MSETETLKRRRPGVAFLCGGQISAARFCLRGLVCDRRIRA